MVPFIMQMPQGRDLWETLCRKPAKRVSIFNTKYLESNLAVLSMQAYNGRLDVERLVRLPILLGHFAHAFNQLSDMNKYNTERDITRLRVYPDKECG